MGEEFEGVFDILFVGAPSPKRIEILMVMRYGDGHVSYLMDVDGVMYFPHTIINMKQVDDA